MSKRILILCLAIIMSFASAYAKEVRIIVRGKYFQPVEQDFIDIYGKGMIYGGEINISVWKRIDIWAGVDYFSNKGELTFSKEETEIQIIPIYGGIKYRLSKGMLNPYIGLGLGYFLYKETNPIGTVEKGNIGYITQLGCLIKIMEGLFLDIHGAYNYCRVKPADKEANLGGLQGGIGLGFEF